MTDPRLPPSRFAAGHTVGGTTPPTAAYRSLAAQPLLHPAATPPPTQPTNRLALLAFIVVVFLGPVGAPITVPMAVVAGRQCTRTGQRGAGIAQASVFIAGAYFALGAVVAILWLALGS